MDTLVSLAIYYTIMLCLLFHMKISVKRKEKEKLLLYALEITGYRLVGTKRKNNILSTR